MDTKSLSTAGVAALAGVSGAAALHGQTGGFTPRSLAVHLTGCVVNRLHQFPVWKERCFDRLQSQFHLTREQNLSRDSIPAAKGVGDLKDSVGGWQIHVRHLQHAEGAHHAALCSTGVTKCTQANERHVSEGREREWASGRMKCDCCQRKFLQGAKLFCLDFF